LIQEEKEEAKKNPIEEDLQRRLILLGQKQI